MRGFDKMSNNVPDFEGSNRSSFDTLIEDALQHREITSHNPKTKMSASMFPMCSILLCTQLWHQRSSGRFWRQANTLLEVFAGAGIAMHEKLQYALGFSGRQYGHYHCKDYKCKEGYIDTKGFRPKVDNPRLHTFTTDNICPHCGKGMAYVEIEIQLDDIIMYLDSVIVVEKDGEQSAMIMDLKSCTSNAAYKATHPRELAKHNNIQQIQAYCVEFERQFDVPVSAYGLAYIPRDNPNGFKVYEVKFTDKVAKKAFTEYKNERRKWKLANKAVTDNDILLSEEGRLCTSQSDHDRLHPYDPCPLSGVCFSQLQLHRVLRDFIELSAKHDTKDYFTVLDMAVNARKQAKRDNGFRVKSEVRARHISI